jgi:hypothetical protein
MSPKQMLMESSTIKMSLITQQFSPAYFNFIVIVIVVISSLIPIWLGSEDSFLDYDEVIPSIESIPFKISSVCLLLSSLPIIFDCTFDIFSGDLNNETFKHQSSFCFGKAVLATITVIIGFHFTFILSASNMIGIFKHPAASYLFSFHCLRFIAAGCVLFFLCLSKPQICTVCITTSLSLLASINGMMKFYSYQRDGVGQVLSHIVVVVTFLAFVIFIGYVFVKLLYNHKVWNVDDYSALLYLLVLTIGLIGSVIPFLSSLIINHNLNANFVFHIESEIAAAVIYSFVLCISLIAIVPGRIARTHALILKVKMYLFCL